MSKWNTSATTSSFNEQQIVKGQMQGRKRDSYSGGTTGYNTLTTSDDKYNYAMGNQAGILGEHYNPNSMGGMLFNTYTNTDLYGAATSHETILGFETGNTTTTGYSIVGINGNKIKDMRTAINNYVEDVQEYLKTAIQASQNQIKTAFRGTDAVNAVDEYLDKVKTYVHNLVSTLLAFSDKLADVGNAWIEAQRDVATNVKSSTGSFSAGTAYSGNEVSYQGDAKKAAGTAVLNGVNTTAGTAASTATSFWK